MRARMELGYFFGPMGAAGLLVAGGWFAGLLVSRHAPPRCAAAGAPIPGGRGTRTLGVDFGLRRTGLAISSGYAPLPLGILPSNRSVADFPRLADAVARHARGEGAAQIVLGMPYNSSGGEGEQASITREFAVALADAAAPLPVFLWDERFSSASASMRMNAGAGAAPGAAVDAVAAAVILEDYFAVAERSAQTPAGAPRDTATPADARAIHVPRSAPSPSGAARAPYVPPQPVPNLSEVRRRMIEADAQTLAEVGDGRAGRGAGASKRQRKGRKRKPR